MTCLFHEVATADSYRRDRLLGLFKITILSAVTQIRLFEIARNNNFELPSALLPQTVDAWNPTSHSIRGRRCCIYVWYTLENIRTF
jgi:hypothetical protein